MKAIGKGLHLPLTSFSVSLAPAVIPALLARDGEPEEPGQWMIYSFNPVDDYRAALVVENNNWNLQFFNWDE